MSLEPLFEFEFPHCHVLGGTPDTFTKRTRSSDYTDVINPEAIEDVCPEIVDQIRFLDRNSSKYLIKIQVFETEEKVDTREE